MSESLSVFFRLATNLDVSVVADFNCRLADETEGKALDRETVKSGVQRGLQQGDEVRYYVAEVDQLVIGQVMVTREWSDWRDGWTMWLQSVYVLSEFRNQGVFRQLFQHVHRQLSTEPDVICIRLYVHNKNATAIATYQKLGFSDSGYSVMECPVGAPAE